MLKNPAAIAIALLAITLAIAAPQYFSAENLTDIFTANVPVLLIALGMTLIIIAGQIDISPGATFAICSVTAGALAKSGAPILLTAIAACTIGAVIGTLNGTLVTRFRIPAIVATLATMAALRDALRWATQGAWISGLPASFQWLGTSQQTYPAVLLAAVALPAVAIAWSTRNLAAGRAIYATGSNPEAARLAGINAQRYTLAVFTLTGILTGFAAILNSARFDQIPANTGLGLELKVIAAVVVGGTAITGGRGTITGTLLGVILLGMIGPALTFLGVSPYWERALQGAIILLAVAFEVLNRKKGRRS